MPKPVGAAGLQHLMSIFFFFKQTWRVFITSFPVSLQEPSGSSKCWPLILGASESVSVMSSVQAG